METQPKLPGFEEPPKTEYQKACEMVIKCRKAYPDGYDTMDDITKKVYDEASNLVFHQLRQKSEYVRHITSRPVPRPQKIQGR